MPSATSDQTANLALPYLLASQADKHVSVNTAFQLLDVLTQCRVESQRVTVEPASPSDGQSWIIPAGATGPAWTNAATGQLAHFQDGDWHFCPSHAGLIAYVRDEARFYVFDGQAWGQALMPGDGVNRLINGAFQIWQRGGTFANLSPGDVGPDRWRGIHTAAGGTVVNWSRIALAPASPLPGCCATGLRVEAQSAGSAPLGFEQAIEDARTLAGRWVCLSFFARASVALVMNPVLEQRFGVAGSAPVSVALTALAVGTSWTRMEASVFLPGLGGKTIGANSALALRLSWPAATGSWLEITGIKLEAGRSATAFDAVGDAAELAACQRYFFSTLAGRKPGAGQGLVGAWLHPRLATGSYFHRMALRLPVKMRTSPTLAFFNPIGPGSQCTDADAGIDCTNTDPLSFGQSAEQVVAFTQTPAAGGVGNMLAVHVTASAEL